MSRERTTALAAGANRSGNLRLFVLVAVALAVACSRGDAPQQPPDITGEITQVTTVSGGLSLRVEASPTDSSGSAKAVVRADGTTRWSRLPLSTGAVRTGAPANVSLGMRVQVWFDGPAAMSYPIQAKAALIVVLATR